MGTQNTDAESTNKSLMRRERTSRQLSEQVVAALSETPTGNELSPNLVITILLGLLTGFSKETLNPDVVWFAIEHAKTFCREHGIPDEEFEAVFDNYSNIAKQLRARNPMQMLFES